LKSEYQYTRSMLVHLRWKVIVGCVDNGGTDDHHRLNFLFIIWYVSCKFTKICIDKNM
jgi:hypothetical protein